MIFRLIICFVFTVDLLHTGFTLTTCGRLKEMYIYNGKSVDCKIRLYPSREMERYIKSLHYYRWIQVTGSDQRVILQKNDERYPYDASKYTEDNYTLHIRNLVESDEGTYKVHCWTGPGTAGFLSSELTVLIPTTAIPNPSTEPQLPDATSGNSLSSSALSVIAVCAVVIVAIIAATVYIIAARRQVGNEGATRLVNHDETSSAQIHHVNNEESVYNEIDIEEMTLDYAKVDEKTFNSSTLAVMHIEDSSALPTRSDITACINGSRETDYDLADDIDTLPIVRRRVADTGEIEYADVVEDEFDEITTERSIEYNKTDKSRYHNKGNIKRNIEDKVEEGFDILSNINTECNTANKTIEVSCDISPEYAKVLKRKPDNATNNQVNQVGCKITFPKIDCTEITQSLGGSIADYQLHDLTTQSREIPTYSNHVCRSQRSKSRQNRASRREVQYAVLDHSKVEPVHTGKTNDDDNETPCQYAAIDFGKQAFIAPVRKAPSSWYKRRNKKKKMK